MLQIKDTPPIFVREVLNWINLDSRSMSPGWFNFRPLRRKLAECLWFATPLISRNTTDFWLLPIRAAITLKRRLGHPNQLIFSESWVPTDSVGAGPGKFSWWKLLGTESLQWWISVEFSWWCSVPFPWHLLCYVLRGNIIVIKLKTDTIHHVDFSPGIWNPHWPSCQRDQPWTWKSLRQRYDVKLWIPCSSSFKLN